MPALAARRPILTATIVSRRPAVFGMLIGELRDQAVELTGSEQIEPAKLARVAPTDLLMAAGTILGIYLLIGQFADVASVGDVFAGVI